MNYEEGSKHADNLYSTQEWSETYGDGRVYRGKWGHSLEVFRKEAECTDSAFHCNKNVPALFVIGGKLDSMNMDNSVFRSAPGGELK